MSDPAIRVENLKFSWRADRPVLQGCSLDVPAGKLWMLLGNNGSGKSTLLRVLAGILTPQSGSFSLSGLAGFVFQNPDRQLVMPTVGADVAFGLVREGLDARQTRARVREALAAVNLAHLERRPIYALSGGQKQRIAIAGALARRSEILLLDEPTALLDPDAQQELVTQVRELVDRHHLTALWVTHRLDELNHCDGAVLLEAGRAVDCGEPHRLRQRLQAQDRI